MAGAVVKFQGRSLAWTTSGWPDSSSPGSGEPCARASRFAFDLIELDGEDIRRLPLVEACTGSPEALRTRRSSLPKIFDHACRLGLEGIVAKKARSTYVSGRCPSWRKVLNPNYVRGPSRAF